MTVLVIDLEATCWDREHPETNPTNQPSEIIEIGVVLLDNDYNFIKSKSYIVKPRFSKVSSFCTKLTGWTQELVDQGKSMSEVLEQLNADFQLSSVNEWWSYGAYDKNKLSGDYSIKGSIKFLYNLESPFDNIVHVNCKEEFAYCYRLDRPVGMAKALNIAKIKLEGRHHNGEDDAKNIAKIVKHLNQP